MNEKEEFQKILAYFQQKYNLGIQRPYGDGFMQIMSGGRIIGQMNSDGYSLCHNLHQLTEIIESTKY